MEQDIYVGSKWGNNMEQKLSINTNINVFKNNIANVIQNSQLPVGVVYYIFKDIINELQIAYENTLRQEVNNLQNSLIQDNNEEDDGK